MQNYERELGAGYPQYGQGHFLRSLPTSQQVIYSDFSGGLDTRNAREDTPANSSPNALDVEVTHQDRLRPVPGTTILETLSRSADQMVLQASLDYTAELVLFDAPYMGVKTASVTQWFNAGLPADDRLFASVNFGGSLVFSNGHTGLYIREAGKNSVKLIEHGPAAHTFASFAGRIFAGASIIGGNREPLGISWSGASSDPEEWDQFNEDGSQTGAGSELLIDDMAQGNYIVALRTMGLDFMAIFLRNSIWIGRRTSQLLRPADFQPRVTGVGAINEATCIVTRFGVLHLHDSGVYLFDGNTTTLISEQINNELLPLDRAQLNSYRSAYNPLTKLFYLFTPTFTWVYDLEKQRWHKRSLVARGASVFATQIAAKTWAELTGTWGAQTGTWEDYKARETGNLEFVFLGDSTTATRLDKEDSTSQSNFSKAMEPYWEFPLQQGPSINQLISTKAIFVEYQGGGKLDLWLPDNDSAYVFRRQISLATASSGPRLYPAFCEYTGRGLGLRIVFQEGFIEILRVQLTFLLRGPVISTVEEFVDTGPDSFSEIFSTYPNGASAKWTSIQSVGTSDQLLGIFDIIGGEARFINNDALNNYAAATLNGTEDATTALVENLFRFNILQAGFTQRGPGACLLFKANVLSSQGYSGYYVHTNIEVNSGIVTVSYFAFNELGQQALNNSAFLAQFAGLTTSTHLWIAAEVYGPVDAQGRMKLRVKMWKDGTAEPDWVIDALTPEWMAGVSGPSGIAHRGGGPRYLESHISGNWNG